MFKPNTNQWVRQVHESVLKSFLLFIFTFVSATTFLHAQTITGNVFRDFNANGTKDNSATFNEIGLGGVTVTCTDSAGGTGTTTTSTTVATLGNYSLTGCTAATRVEFVWTLAGDYAGAAGTGNNTSVQFINATRSNVNYGINYPSHYSIANPKIITSLLKTGDPTAAGNNVANDDIIHTFPYAFADNASYTGSGTGEQNVGKGTVGGTFGIALQRSTQQVFISAFLKRHTALGANGLGGIYKTDLTAGSPTTAPFINLASAPYNINFGTIGSNSARGIPADKTLPSTDPTAFPLVGKAGIGDIDISDDETTLWLTNLHDRQLYSVRIGVPAAAPAASDVVGYALPASVTCTAGVARPFGVKFYRGKVLVGVVCTAESGVQADLNARVLEFNPTGAAWTTLVSPFALNFTRGCGSQPLGIASDCKWNPWTDTYNAAIERDLGSEIVYQFPQPILSDIEVDVDGSLILGFKDRNGDQIGWFNNRPTGGGALTVASVGDMMRVCFSGGTYTVESGGNVCGLTGAANSQGPGGGEFYHGDNVNTKNSPTTGNHRETTTGGIALWAGKGQVITATYNPLESRTGGGAELFSNTDGQSNSQFELYISGAGTFGKANGLGDMELISTPPPLEIGNRVWLDTDTDGVQDASEVGLDGITVTLTCGANMATTTTATVNGQTGVYFFKDGQAGLPAAWNSQIPRNTACKLSVAKDQTVAAVTYMATSANIGGAPGDTIDSDGTVSGTNAEVMLTTGFAGQNNHTYDFGFSSTPPPTCTTITNNTNVEMVNETELSTTNNTSSVAVQVNCTVTYDWGDNPDTGAGSGAGNYLTSTTDNGPRHIIVTGLKLGATVDAETDGQPTGTLSTGDDTTGAPDDEDSVTIPTLSETVATTLNFTLMNMTGTAAKLCGWIDFNKNGVYDNTTERQCTNVADAATTATLSFTAPTGSAGTTYARFRLSTDAAFLTAMESTGEATSGEVEDYQVTITAGCAINTPTIVATCGNNGTPSDPADDTFTFTISATGTAAGASYKVDKTAPAPTATVFPTVNYGTTSAASSAFPISGGALTLTLTDNTTPTCTLTPVTVTPPATCSSVVQADLELTKVADKTQVRVGDTLTYTLRLENKGPGSASGIKIRDLVPAGLTFVSATPSLGTYTSATGIWDVGTLTNGQVVTLTIVTTVQ